MDSIPSAIVLEEHFVAPSMEHDYESNPFGAKFGNVFTKLTELGDQRIKDMDAGKITRQIISHAPALSPSKTSDCLQANETLHTACKAHPERFLGAGYSSDE